jgi:amidophosphoribosyltransferase
MILDAGAKEVHFRIASPPTAWPCFYGVETPNRDKLLAAQMSEEEAAAYKPIVVHVDDKNAIREL